MRLLGQLGEADQARPFLQKMADDAKTPGQLRLIADLGHELKRDDLAVMVAKTARAKDVAYALVNAFGFGGVNASLLLTKAPV